MKINLPKRPVDGYEIKFFSIEYDRVQECHILYHKKTRWADLYPTEGRGADFVDQWQVFRGETCEGRIDGWIKPLRCFENPKNLFLDRGKAVAALRKRLTAKVENYEQLAEETRLQIQELESGD